MIFRREQSTDGDHIPVFNGDVEPLASITDRILDR
jgi:hypothetical protein